MISARAIHFIAPPCFCSSSSGRVAERTGPGFFGGPTGVIGKLSREIEKLWPRIVSLVFSGVDGRGGGGGRDCGAGVEKPGAGWVSDSFGLNAGSGEVSGCFRG